MNKYFFYLKTTDLDGVVEHLFYSRYPHYAVRNITNIEKFYKSSKEASQNQKRFNSRWKKAKLMKLEELTRFSK